MIVKYIEQRQERREAEGRGRKVTDITLLKTIARHLADVIGIPQVVGDLNYIGAPGMSANWGTFCTPFGFKSCCTAVLFASPGGHEANSGSITLIMHRCNSRLLD